MYLCDGVMLSVTWMIGFLRHGYAGTRRTGQFGLENMRRCTIAWYMPQYPPYLKQLLATR
jgi:hypothetical protein